MSKKINTRIEKDSMGSFEVPAEAYYGANTMRAVVKLALTWYLTAECVTL